MAIEATTRKLSEQSIASTLPPTPTYSMGSLTWTDDDAKVLLCENDDPTNPTKPRGTSFPKQEIVVSALVLEQVKQE